MCDQILPNVVFAIDPGNLLSAFAIVDTTSYYPIKFAKCANVEIKQEMIEFIKSTPYPIIIIETMVSMGGSVGATVFDTCIFIGRLTELAESLGASVHYINRRQEKIELVGSMRAKDSDIRRALINRLAVFDKVNGKGTSDHRDVFWGMAGDCWQSMWRATSPQARLL